MSGLEVAGVVLGTFPLLISGIERWRDVAKVGGFYWRIRKEYTKCQRDVQFHEILYKNNLKELLLPLVSESNQVVSLIADPGGQTWSDKALQKRLEGRLQDSYQLYQDTITEMNEITNDLKNELCFEKDNIQSRLSPPETKQSSSRSLSPHTLMKSSKLSAVKGRLDFEWFRTRFSIGESVRNDLFSQLKDCNERLEKLLRSNDRVSAIQDATPRHTKQTSLLDSTFKKISQKSEQVFKALNNAWNCSCQQYHYANLRLEHRLISDICFEIILMFMAPPEHGDTAWSWREIRCGHMLDCSIPLEKGKAALRIPVHNQPSPPSGPITILPESNGKGKRVNFSSVALPLSRTQVNIFSDQDVQLCRQLGNADGETCGKCMGIITHDDEIFHIHPATQKWQFHTATTATLNRILGRESAIHLSRRQRYAIALQLASSVAQLQYTPWLRVGFCKEDIIFFIAEDDSLMIPQSGPFIRQGFFNDHVETLSTCLDASERNFYSLGILLLELCFGCRLEDYQGHNCPATKDAAVKHAFDIVAALKWSGSVSDEGGDDYAKAVKWCFTGATDRRSNWRTEIIANVVRPLEMCMEHFEAVATLGKHS